MRLLLATAAIAAAFAMPVMADQTAPATPAAGAGSTTTTVAVNTTVAPKADEGIICKSKQVTGTRFVKKVCTTKAQRDEEAAQGRDALGSTRIEAVKAPGE